MRVDVQSCGRGSSHSNIFAASLISSIRPIDPSFSISFQGSPLFLNSIQPNGIPFPPIRLRLLNPRWGYSRHGLEFPKSESGLSIHWISIEFVSLKIVIEPFLCGGLVGHLAENTNSSHTKHCHLLKEPQKHPPGVKAIRRPLSDENSHQWILSALGHMVLAAMKCFYQGDSGKPKVFYI